MLEPHDLLTDIVGFFQPKLLANKHVLVTAGPTVEPIDPVRIITNRSSGKTGYAIARAAHEAGARVTLITGPVSLAVPRGIETTIPVLTAREMHAAVMAHVQLAQIFIAVAAVTDWYVKDHHTQKLKKAGKSEILSLEFEPNPDILADVAALTDGPWCVGFAAETEKLAQHASRKRERKGVPLIVGNIAQDVIGADMTELTLFDEQGSHPLPAATKQSAARRLIAEIAQRLPPDH
jgi:phosphopantothenoylcysteine decarboxylase/phosphopantothenate--cysteine ligase